MPIEDAPSTPESWEDIKEPFVIFYASKKDGVMWCPVSRLASKSTEIWILQDCRAVEGLVKETFEAEDSPSAIIIYVGQRDEWVDLQISIHYVNLVKRWKSPKNQWRQTRTSA